MAIFGNQSPLNAPASAPANNGKPEAQIFGNIGYWAPNEDGEKVFVSLPMGVGIDTMRHVSAGSSKLMQAKNALLDQLNDLTKDLKSGKEMEIPLLFVARRRSDHEQTTAADNPFIAAMGDLKKTA